MDSFDALSRSRCRERRLNKCRPIGDVTKAATCRSPNCIRKTKKNKIRWRTIFNVALGSWHWIRQVAAPCNVTRDSGMTYHWIRPNVCHIGNLLPVSFSTISPQSACHSAPVCEILSKPDCPRQKNDCTLQCDMWLWNRDNEFTKWQHPANWYVALGWHAIEFAQTSAILEFYLGRKNDVMSIFKIAELSHLGC